MRASNHPNPPRPPDAKLSKVTGRTCAEREGDFVSPLDALARSRLSTASQFSFDDEILSRLPVTPEMTQASLHQGDSDPRFERASASQTTLPARSKNEQPTRVGSKDPINGCPAPMVRGPRNLADPTLKSGSPSVSQPVTPQTLHTTLQDHEHLNKRTDSFRAFPNTSTKTPPRAPNACASSIHIGASTAADIHPVRQIYYGSAHNKKNLVQSEYSQPPRSPALSSSKLEPSSPALVPRSPVKIPRSPKPWVFPRRQANTQFSESNVRLTTDNNTLNETDNYALAVGSLSTTSIGSDKVSTGQESLARRKFPPLQLRLATSPDSSTQPSGLSSATEFSTSSQSSWSALDSNDKMIFPPRSASSHRAQAQSWDSVIGGQDLNSGPNSAGFVGPFVLPKQLSRPRTPISPRKAPNSPKAGAGPGLSYYENVRALRVPPPFDPSSTRDHVAMGVYNLEAGNEAWVLHHWRHASTQGHPIGILLYNLALREGWGVLGPVPSNTEQPPLPQCLHIDPLELLALVPPPCLRIARAFERLAKAYKHDAREAEMVRAYQLAQVVSQID